MEETKSFIYRYRPLSPFDAREVTLKCSVCKIPEMIYFLDYIEIILSCKFPNMECGGPLVSPAEERNDGQKSGTIIIITAPSVAAPDQTWVPGQSFLFLLKDPAPVSIVWLCLSLALPLPLAGNCLKSDSDEERLVFAGPSFSSLILLLLEGNWGRESEQVK